MIPGVMLTPRDRRVLRDAYDHTVLSFAQIHRRHFANVAKQTVSNRLSKLVGAGLIRRQRVGTVIYQMREQEIGSVFQITRKGIATLRGQFEAEAFRDEPVRLNTSTLSHDLLLTECMDALRKKHPHASVVHGKLYAAHGNSNFRIPDAVLEFPRGGERMAVELELTAKSTRRYVEIVNRYRIQNQYQKVLYIVSDASIAEKIRYQITGAKAQAGLPQASTGRFSFVTVSDLIPPLNDSKENKTPTGLVAIAPGASSIQKGSVHESQNSMAFAPNG